MTLKNRNDVELNEAGLPVQIGLLLPSTNQNVAGGYASTSSTVSTRLMNGKGEDKKTNAVQASCKPFRNSNSSSVSSFVWSPTLGNVNPSTRRGGSTMIGQQQVILSDTSSHRHSETASWFGGDSSISSFGSSMDFLQSSPGENNSHKIARNEGKCDDYSSCTSSTINESSRSTASSSSLLSLTPSQARAVSVPIVQGSVKSKRESIIQLLSGSTHTTTGSSFPSSTGRKNEMKRHETKERQKKLAESPPELPFPQDDGDVDDVDGNGDSTKTEENKNCPDKTESTDETGFFTNNNEDSQRTSTTGSTRHSVHGYQRPDGWMSPPPYERHDKSNTIKRRKSYTIKREWDVIPSPCEDQSPYDMLKDDSTGKTARYDLNSPSMYSMMVNGTQSKEDCDHEDEPEDGRYYSSSAIRGYLRPDHWVSPADGDEVGTTVVQKNSHAVIQSSTIIEDMAKMSNVHQDDDDGDDNEKEEEYKVNNKEPEKRVSRSSGNGGICGYQRPDTWVTPVDGELQRIPSSTRRWSRSLAVVVHDDDDDEEEGNEKNKKSKNDNKFFEKDDRKKERKDSPPVVVRREEERTTEKDDKNDDDGITKKDVNVVTSMNHKDMLISPKKKKVVRWEQDDCEEEEEEEKVVLLMKNLVPGTRYDDCCDDGDDVFCGYQQNPHDDDDDDRTTTTITTTSTGTASTCTSPPTDMMMNLKKKKKKKSILKNWNYSKDNHNIRPSVVAEQIDEENMHKNNKMIEEEEEGINIYNQPKKEPSSITSSFRITRDESRRHSTTGGGGICGYGRPDGWVSTTTYDDGTNNEETMGVGRRRPAKKKGYKVKREWSVTIVPQNDNDENDCFSETNPVSVTTTVDDTSKSTLTITNIVEQSRNGDDTTIDKNNINNNNTKNINDDDHDDDHDDNDNKNNTKKDDKDYYESGSISTSPNNMNKKKNKSLLQETTTTTGMKLEYHSDNSNHDTASTVTSSSSSSSSVSYDHCDCWSTTTNNSTSRLITSIIGSSTTNQQQEQQELEQEQQDEMMVLQEHEQQKQNDNDDDDDDNNNEKEVVVPPKMMIQMWWWDDNDNNENQNSKPKSNSSTGTGSTTTAVVVPTRQQKQVQKQVQEDQIIMNSSTASSTTMTPPPPPPQNLVQQQQSPQPQSNNGKKEEESLSSSSSSKDNQPIKMWWHS